MFNLGKLQSHMDDRIQHAGTEESVANAVKMHRKMLLSKADDFLIALHFDYQESVTSLSLATVQPETQIEIVRYYTVPF